jgi:Secretion system C-terminal sorting domain
MKKLILSMIMALTSLAIHAQTINVSTGVDNAGNALAQYTTDPFWKITDLNPNNAIVSDIGPWEPEPVAGTNAMFINNTGNQCCSNAVGIHTFERSFTVPSGAAQFTYNLSIAYDDAYVSFELVKPDLTTIPITVTPSSTPYYLSNNASNTVSTLGATGLWKIRATINFIDVFAGFMCSGNVVIPQQVTTCLTPVADAMIHEYQPSNNYGSIPALAASRWTYNSSGGSGFYTTKTLHKYDFSSIPAGATILSATLTQHVCTTCGISFTSHKDLSGLGNAGSIQQVNSPWTENTVTWNTPLSSSGPVVSIASPGNGSTADLVSNITTIVQNIISGGANNGFEISVTDNSDYYHSLVYASRENPDSNLRPQLCITYTTNSNPCNQIVTVSGAGCGTLACPYTCTGLPAGGTFSGPIGLNATTGVYIGAIPVAGLPYTYVYTSGACTYTVNGTITKTTAASISLPTLSPYTGPTAAGAQVVVTWPSTGYTCGEWYEFRVKNSAGTILCTVTSTGPSNTFPFGYTPLPVGTSGKIITCPGLVIGQAYCVEMRINRCGIFSSWTGCMSTTAAKTNSNTTFNESNTNVVSVYPNPVSSELNIDYNATQSGELKIIMMDMSGRIVKQRLSKVELGINKLSIDTQDVVPGLYTLQLLEGKKLIHLEKLTVVE